MFGLDHAGALGDAGDGDRRAADRRPAARPPWARVSVVMIASAAASPVVGAQVGDAAGSAGLDAVDRQRLHDHAGGERQHLRRLRSRARAPARRRSRARARRPSSPVPALALPVLMTSARIAGVLRQVLRGTRCTGAAQKRFCVNTPATAAPSSSAISSRSLRLALRMPASAMPSRRRHRMQGSAGFGRRTG